MIEVLIPSQFEGIKAIVMSTFAVFSRAESNGRLRYICTSSIYENLLQATLQTVLEFHGVAGRTQRMFMPK